MKTRQILVLLVLIAAAAAGCSTDRSVQPLGPAQAGEARAQSAMMDAGWIGPAGGVLEISGATLQVPEGALRAATLIQIERLEDGSIELSPDGQRFSTPVSLFLAATPGGMGSDDRIEWFDPVAATWVPIPSVATGDGRIAPLAHFSLYRIVAFQ